MRIAMKLTIEVWSQTDTGKIRDHNEDCYWLSEDLDKQESQVQMGSPLLLGKMGSILAVADGMGGTNAGEVASELAVREVNQSFKQVHELPEDPHQFLKEVIMRAHQAILKHAKDHPQTRGMGTTLILAWVVNGLLYVAWSGDSRCYLFREGIEFRPLTDDHSLVWEMVKNNILTAEQARTHPDSNIITQSLGNSREAPKPEALRQAIPLQKGDRLLLCSDGLNSMVPDPQIGTILIQGENAKRTCESLIESANIAGGYDNITTLLLDVLDVELTPPPPPQTSSQPEIIPAQDLPAEAPISPTLSQEEESSPSSSSWLWIIGGIFLFGGLTFAVLFWLGKKENQILDSPPIPSLVEYTDSDSATVDSSLVLVASNESGNTTRGITPNESGSSERIAEPPTGNESTDAESDIDSPPSPADPEEVQIKVRQILDLKYSLIRHDRLEILQYRRLSQSQKDNLRYIRTRLLNQQPKSIYHDLTRLVRLGGDGQSEIVEIREKDGEKLNQQLDALIQELQRFDLLIEQMEQ